jgi:tetratricopeptide (TPR) repeat protein
LAEQGDNLVATKKHHKAPPALGPEVLRSRVERAAEEGRFQHALELAKQLHKQAPTPAHRDLLGRVYLGRARQLQAQGHERDAVTVLEAALALGGADRSWQENIALQMARAGNARRALQILERLGTSAMYDQVLRYLADAALAQGKAGRDALPEPLRPQFDLVLQAFRHLENAKDDAARQSLQGIGLQSPFLEWKLLLRGLLGFYQKDDVRAVENWQRLDPERLPARLVAPLRFQIDRFYRDAQPAPTQAVLKKQADRLQDAGLVPLLRSLQGTLSNTEELSRAFRVAQDLTPALRQQAPQLVGRLAQCFFWTIVHHGEPGDVTRYERLFGAPADDSNLSRMRALLHEQLFQMDRAHAHWQELDRAVAAHPEHWPGGQANRVRALIWRHMGENARSIPDENKLDLLPPFLRDHPDRPRPIKPTAEECFRRSLDLAPDQLETHEALFAYYQDNDQPEKAIEAGRRLLEHFPRHAPTLVELGDLLVGQSEYVEALGCYQRALEANPLDQRLRGKISTAHLFHARSHAEEGRFDEARLEYQAALETSRTREDATVLCKWAACEFKAGNAEQAEQLLGRALASPGGRLAVAFSMVIEAIRLKMPKLKKRFNDEFNRALAEQPTAAAAAAIVDTASAHRMANVTYHGQKTHEKKVLAYLDRARDVDSTEGQLLQVCRGLLTLDADRLLQEFAALGQERFPNNPHFFVLEAESYIAQGPYRCPRWRVQPLLERAQQLAQKMPPGDEQKALLDLIKHRQQLVGAQGLLGGLPLGMFDPLMGPFDDYDEDYDDYDDDY